MSASLSCNADGNMSSQDIGGGVSVPRQTPPQSPGPCNPGRMEVGEWVHYTQQHPPLPPADGHDILGANPSGRHHTCSPPAGNRYPEPHNHQCSNLGTSGISLLTSQDAAMAVLLEVREVTPMILGHHLPVAQKTLDVVEMRLLAPDARDEQCPA